MKSSLRGRIALIETCAQAYEVVVISSSDTDCIGIRTQGGVQSTTLKVFRRDQIRRIHENMKRVAEVVDRMDQFIRNTGPSPTEVVRSLIANKAMIEDIVEEDLRRQRKNAMFGRLYSGLPADIPLVGTMQELLGSEMTGACPPSCSDEFFTWMGEELHNTVEMADETELEVPQDIHHLVINAGDGCTINFTGKVDYAKVNTGDGGSLDFDNVGEADVIQGAGASMVVASKPDAFKYSQGPGSHAINQ